MVNGLFDALEDTRQVDTMPLEALETKVNLVVDRLKTLQEEKAELQREVDTWRKRYEEAARQVEELVRERDSLKENQRDPGQEEIIRSKITALLAKLEAA